MKECLRCHDNLLESEFGWRNKQHTKRRPYCNECMRLYRKEHYQSNKQQYFERSRRNKFKIRKYIWNYLDSRECADCGEEDNIILEFDHIKDKKDNISSMVRAGKSLKTIKEEIDKCEIRCANCHRRKTAKDKNWWIDMK